MHLQRARPLTVVSKPSSEALAVQAWGLDSDLQHLGESWVVCIWNHDTWRQRQEDLQSLRVDQSNCIDELQVDPITKTSRRMNKEDMTGIFTRMCAHINTNMCTETCTPTGCVGVMEEERSNLGLCWRSYTWLALWFRYKFLVIPLPVIGK